MIIELLLLRDAILGVGQKPLNGVVFVYNPASFKASQRMDLYVMHCSDW
jgi:hypothetical protein